MVLINGWILSVFIGWTLKGVCVIKKHFKNGKSRSFKYKNGKIVAVIV